MRPQVILPPFIIILVIPLFIAQAQEITVTPNDQITFISPDPGQAVQDDIRVLPPFLRLKIAQNSGGNNAGQQDQRIISDRQWPQFKSFHHISNPSFYYGLKVRPSLFPNMKKPLESRKMGEHS